MISKDEVRDAGINMIESGWQHQAAQNDLLAQFKELLPNVINSDNQLDTKALQDVVNIANTTSNDQGYELTFAGKGLARHAADTPTPLELKTEPKQSKNDDTTENVVLRGDNLDALKILYQNYHKKIKMIYIDPPYNTKSENFVYKDNFKKTDEALIEELGLNDDTTDFLHNVYGTRSHSGWLAFMYPRLKLARELLRDDGVIFISIDEHEQANLKIICDEIFGEENFIAAYVWEARSGKDHTAKHVSVNHEYIFCYAKRIASLELSRDVRITTGGNYSDENGTYSRVQIRQWGTNDRRIDRPTMYYPVIAPDGSKIYPIKQDGTEGCWRISESRMKESIKKNSVDFVYDKEMNKWVVYSKKYDGKETKTAYKSILHGVGTSANGTKELKNLLHQKVFETTKPLGLIKHLLHLSLHNTSNQLNTDLILDFFAGSGTTGDAVMQMNAEDGGKRKFILVQWDESIDAKKSAEAYQFCKDNNLPPFISSICLARLHRAGDKIIADNNAKPKDKKDLSQLDIGYKVYRLTEKPKIIEQDDCESADDPNTAMPLFTIQNDRAGTADTLANMLAATCKPLHTPIQCVQKDLLYQADNEIYLLGDIAPQELTNYKNLKINLDGWADITLQNYLNLDATYRSNMTVVY